MSLSKQELVDCARKENGYSGCKGCGGGVGSQALEYIRKNGIVLTEHYPYNAEQATKCLRPNRKPFISPGTFDVGQLPANANAKQIKQALTKYGPLYITIVAGENEFKNYEKGVFTVPTAFLKSKAKVIDHAVVLIGYGTSQIDGESYWIIRNSYGKSKC